MLLSALCNAMLLNDYGFGHYKCDFRGFMANRFSKEEPNWQCSSHLLPLAPITILVYAFHNNSLDMSDLLFIQAINFNVYTCPQVMSYEIYDRE